MPKEYKSKKKTEFDAIASASSEIGNKPPQAPEIEESVIGALMIEEECVYKATEVLTEKSFYDPKLRLIYRAISAHLQTSVGGYPKSLHSLNMKNGRSDTPLS